MTDEQLQRLEELLQSVEKSRKRNIYNGVVIGLTPTLLAFMFFSIVRFITLENNFKKIEADLIKTIKIQERKLSIEENKKILLGIDFNFATLNKENKNLMLISNLNPDVNAKP